MQRALTILASVALASHLHADTVKIVVNGREIETSVIESNGAIYVPVETLAKALGVEVTIKSNEVAVPTTTVSLSAPPRAAVAAPIKGKLTYQFSLLDTRPDVGAQAWLATDADTVKLAAATGGTLDEPISQRTVGWNAQADTFAHAVADSSGEFSFENVPPGVYTLILKSVHSNGLAPRDRQGKFRFKKIQVRDGQTVDASFNFGMAAYTK